MTDLPDPFDLTDQPATERAEKEILELRQMVADSQQRVRISEQRRLSEDKEWRRRSFLLDSAQLVGYALILGGLWWNLAVMTDIRSGQDKPVLPARLSQDQLDKLAEDRADLIAAHNKQLDALMVHLGRLEKTISQKPVVHVPRKIHHVSHKPKPVQVAALIDHGFQPAILASCPPGFIRANKDYCWDSKHHWGVQLKANSQQKTYQ